MEHNVRHLSAQEVADRWGCSVGWLNNQRSAGRGAPFLRLGSRVVYPLWALEEHEAGSLVRPVNA